MKFSYKLALTIALSVIITFVVLDISLILLYKLVVSQQVISDGYDINAFNEFSSTEILTSTGNYLETGFDIYEQVIAEVYRTYQKFHNNPQLYTSKLKRGQNPQLSSSFTSPRYDRSSVYFFTPESTFYDQPYMDSSLSCALTETHPVLVRRVNVFYQNKTDQTNLMVRTTPGTDEFFIPNISVINQRFDTSPSGNITLTSWYYDQFSLSNDTTQLIAIRLLFPDSNQQYRMLIEIQIQLQLLNDSLNQIYSYESTAIALLYVQDFQNDKYSLLGSSKTLQKYSSFIDLSQYLTVGIYNISTDQGQFLLSTTLMKNDESVGDFGQNQFSYLRLILILNKSQTNLANSAYTTFLVSQENALIQFLFVWSFIVIIVMIGIGYALADYLFSYFSLVKKKCKQYINSPEKAETLYFEMKQIASQQNHNRIIIENMISIIQKIQAKKKENQGLDVRKNFVKEKKRQKKSTISEKTKLKDKKKQNPFDEYPLNLLCKEFQEKMKMKDGERFQKIRNQLEEKILAARAAAAAAKSIEAPPANQSAPVKKD